MEYEINTFDEFGVATFTDDALTERTEDFKVLLNQWKINTYMQKTFVKLAKEEYIFMWRNDVKMTPSELADEEKKIEDNERTLEEIEKKYSVQLITEKEIEQTILEGKED